MVSENLSEIDLDPANGSNSDHLDPMISAGTAMRDFVKSAAFIPGGAKPKFNKDAFLGLVDQMRQRNAVLYRLKMNLRRTMLTSISPREMPKSQI